MGDQSRSDEETRSCCWSACTDMTSNEDSERRGIHGGGSVDLQLFRMLQAASRRNDDHGVGMIVR